MNYTLDTDAIRKRFAEAIVGIRADGSMAVLVETIAGNYLDIVDGGWYDGDTQRLIRNFFPTLIRPGDRCEGEDSTGKVTGVYRGFSGDLTLPHCIQPSTYVCPVSDSTPPIYHLQSIRPLPEPVAEANNWPTVAARLMEQLLEPSDSGTAYMVKLGNVLVEARAARDRASK